MLFSILRVQTDDDFEIWFRDIFGKNWLKQEPQAKCLVLCQMRCKQGHIRVNGRSARRRISQAAQVTP
ncbi:hypothetical protein NQ317_005960 [Molorchus minor]|uniref:Uncharacterized protein n=1 Tax=Molorchus minor TaxID=1323400 RepID=A0ABQ9JJL4_9CUCU|nr:hypothetical protein NQ317_005960 [Molorchus minor]